MSPHDDYDKWAIDILVNFRNEEKLQLLTGQRQSGGVSQTQSRSDQFADAFFPGAFPDDHPLPDESDRSTNAVLFGG